MTPTPSKSPALTAEAAPLAEAGIFGLRFLTRSRLKRLVKFGLVGVSGVAVNLLIFELLYRLAGVPFSLANAIGIVVSIFTNFLLNDTWTWGDRSKGGRWRDWAGRAVKYYIAAAAAAGVQLGVAWLAMRFVFGPLHLQLPAWLDAQAPHIDLAPTLSVLSGIVVGMAINFLAGHLWAFRDVEASK